MQSSWQLFGLSEPVFRFGIFALALVTMAALELSAPRRQLVMPWWRRWVTNASFVALGTVVVRGLAALAAATAVPLVALGAALWAQSQGIGLFNLFTLPIWLDLLLTILILDFAIWLQHYGSHLVPQLWAFHRVHHSDRDIDVTTALRFHPVEIGLSMVYKSVWVIALGVSPLAIVVFEVLLNACAMFNHANWAMPRGFDRVVRLVLVTPDMHRVHHSTHRDEHNTNFGFNLSIWDRLFGTYTAEPRDGHQDMTIGLPPYQHDGPTELGWSLKLPFTGNAGSSPGSKETRE